MSLPKHKPYPDEYREVKLFDNIVKLRTMPMTKITGKNSEF
jgi:hypothetical protein